MDVLEELDDATVAAVCDVDEAAATEAAESHDAIAYSDHVRMYEEEDLDAVFVVLPPFAHEDQELLAAEHGIDMFVEKPLGLSNRKVEEINDAIQDSGVIASVGYQNRYADATRRALELVGDRQLALVEGRYISGVPTPPGHWWREYEKSGGQVVEQATHIYDLVRLFGGSVESVSAVGANEVVEDIDFEDVVSTNLVHEEQTIGHVSSTSASPKHTSGIELVGEDLYLELSGNALSGEVDGEEVEYEGENDPSRDAVEAFVEAVESDDPSAVHSDYEDGMRSFAVTLAAEEALEAGESVDL